LTDPPPPPRRPSIKPHFQVHNLFSFDLAGVKALGQIGRMDSRVIDRFQIRPAANGFRVVDAWMGETVVIAMTAQDEMSEEDAVHTARMLNERGERKAHE
jgi:hypothetical protein